MFTNLQYWLLKKIAPHEPRYMSGNAYKNRSKLKVLLGEDVFEQTKGKVVIDFGCGDGMEAIDVAQNGAAKVIGIDIRKNCLEGAARNAIAAGTDTVCQFRTQTDQLADVIISVDSFEHFDDPEGALRKMYDLLKPGGVVMGSFGPPWYHPYGGHLFSVFPWAHLIFSEEALIRWRSDLRSDGARRFSEVAGGLNQMTIRRFKRLLKKSQFSVEYLKAVPIRKLKLIHNRLTMEFTTSIIRCKLVRASAA